MYDLRLVTETPPAFVARKITSHTSQVRKRSALPLPLANHARGEAAAGLPVGNDRERARLEGAADVVANLVCRGLEENTLVAEGVEIELQRLEFDAPLVGDVAHYNGAEIRMPRHRAHRRELVV